MALASAPAPERGAELPAGDLGDSSARDRFLRSLAWVCVVASAITTIAVALAADRGIDLTDESLYLTMTDQPLRSVRSPTGYHILLHPFFELVGSNVVRWRMLRAALDIGVDVFFGMSVVAFLRSTSPHDLLDHRHARVAVTAALTVIGFMSWSWAPNGFGYNEAASILHVAIAAVLLRLAIPQAGPQVQHLLYGSWLGGLLVLLTVTRWMAAAAAIAGIALVLAMMRDRKPWSVVLSAFVGAVAMLVAIDVAVVDLGILARGMSDGTADVAAGPHGGLGQIVGYLELIWVGVSSAFGLIVAVGLVFLSFRAHRAGQINARMCVGLVTAALFINLLLDRAFGFGTVFSVNSWGTVFAILCVVILLREAVLASKDSPRDHLNGLAIPALLIMFPVTAAAGTINPLFMVSVAAAPLWLAGVAMLLLRRPLAGHAAVLAVSLLVVLVGVAPLSAIRGLHLAPYRVDGAQDREVAAGRLAGVQTTAATAVLLDELEAIRVGLEPDPTVITFWALPIVPFALDGHGLGFPWYQSDLLEVTAASIAGSCEDNGAPTGQVVVVIPPQDLDALGPIDEALRSCDISFPQDFTKVSSLTTSDPAGLDVYVRDGS